MSEKVSEGDKRGSRGRMMLVCEHQLVAGQRTCPQRKGWSLSKELSAVYILLQVLYAWE